MKISAYGLNLIKLNESNFKKVLNWRNSDHVREKMLYTKSISELEHINWFNNLDKELNYYFIINLEDKKDIGVCHIKNIVNGSGEAGIYVHDLNYQNSDVGFRSMIALYEFCFDDLGLNNIFATVKRDNEKAVSFNKKFGYELDNEFDSYYTLKLKRDEFVNKVSKFKKIFNKLPVGWEL